jgi:hypothetical protein
MDGADHKHPPKSFANQWAYSMVSVENTGSPLVSADHKAPPMVGANHKVPEISNWHHIIFLKIKIIFKGHQGI